MDTTDWFGWDAKLSALVTIAENDNERRYRALHVTSYVAH
jgi:hypothetical protein